MLDAPSNLGLRPPAPGVVPGSYKLAARFATAGWSPRYDRHDWRLGDGVANADGWRPTPPGWPAASRALVEAGRFPVLPRCVGLEVTVFVHQQLRAG